jgi:uncharacterized protein HemY
VALVLGALAGVAALLGAGGVILAWSLWPSSPPRQAAVAEDEGQRRQEVRDAFRGQGLPVAGEKAQELQRLFEELGAALRAGDQDRIMDHFDLDRMFEELVGLEALPPAVIRDRRNTVRGLRTGLGQAMKRQAGLFNWDGFEVRSAKQLGADEAVVIVRHQAQQGVTLKMRWWVTRRSGGWMIYDLEDLDTSLRLSAAMAIAAAAGPGNFPGLSRAASGVREAIVALTQEDVDTAERKLRAVAGVRLPPKLDALRWMAHGLLGLHRGQFQEALDALERARRLHPDMPCLDLFKGIALNGLGEWGKALRHLEAYRALLGDDAVVCRHLGDALHGLERLPEAAATYRKALDYNPKEADAFLGLVRSLRPQDKRDDVPARFAKLDKLHENFLVCAEDCQEAKDAAGLEQLALAMRKIDPRHAPADYYLSLVRAWAGQADQAVPLFQAALAKEKDAPKREDYRTGFLRAMVQGGKALEAYAVAPAAPETFHFLAAELKQAYRMEDLKRLVALHAGKHPGEPLLPFYRGEVHVWEGNYHLAEKAFAAGLARPPDRPTLERFRSSRVLARYHTGQPLAACAEVAPKQETFAQLASLLLQDEDHPRLQALLEAHAKGAPDDVEVLRYRYRLKVRQGQVAEGVAGFKAALAKQKDEAQRKRTVEEFLSDMAAAGQALEGYRAAPDARQAFEALAGDLLDEDNLAGLRRLLEAHRARHPEDLGLLRYAGELHLKEEAWGKAAEALGQVWKKGPDELRNRYRWQYVYALYKTGKGPQAYREVGPRNETFSQLAHLLVGDRKGAELEELLAAHRAHAGPGPDLDHYEARAKLLLKQPARAIPLLQQAYRKQTDVHQRRSYVIQFVDAMHEAGQGLEGYRAAPDKALAFETLARRLMQQKRDAELERLLQAHAASHPEDAWGQLYRGELHLLRGEVAQADRQFTAALAKAPRPNEWEFRNGLVRARVKAGAVAFTYQELGPGRRTFEQLAWVCLRDGNAGQLQALLGAHRRAEPDDPNVPAWELEVRWLNQDYEGALKLLNEHRGGLFAQPRFRGKRDNYLVRGLVKLRRTAEAVREAEALVKDQRGDAVLLVLAHAARGDVERAAAALARARPEGTYRERCYQDEDLGPILRSEPFRAFRERHPGPKGKRGAER